MITETILKHVFPDNDVIFHKEKSIVALKYPKNNFDEKGYPKGITLTYNQIVKLYSFNDSQPVKFAISSNDFIFQLRFYIESMYLQKGLEFIKEKYIPNEFKYCERTNTLTRYFEPMGKYKQLFDSDEIILLRSYIQSDKINLKFIAYQLNYY